MATKATARQLACCSLLEAEGFMPSGASALVGNFSQECGNNISCAWRPAAVLDHGSQGLAQWRLDRLTSYEAWVKSMNPTVTAEDDLELLYGRLDLQCKYVAIEMKRDYPALDAKLRQGGDVASLTADVCWQYERPSKTLSGIANRIAQAKLVFAGTNAQHAKPVDVSSALSLMSDQHAQAAQSNGLMAAGAGAIGVVGTAAHFSAGIHWWEWVLLGILAFLVVLGVTGAISEGQKAANVKSATTDVTTATPPKVLAAATPATTTTPAAPATPVVDKKAKAAAAKKAEADAIAAANASTHQAEINAAAAAAATNQPLAASLTPAAVPPAPTA